MKLINDHLYNNSISQIIRNPVSTVKDLDKLAKKLGLNIKYNWIDDYDPNAKLQILNIDEKHFGTHFVAVYNNEFYMDPLGLPIARDSLNYLQYTTIPIQNYKYGACGLYCLDFLYHAIRNDIDGFYAQFNMENSII